MVNLKRAYRQLYSRQEDERFQSVDALLQHCRNRQQNSETRWVMPDEATFFL